MATFSPARRGTNILQHPILAVISEPDLIELHVHRAFRESVADAGETISGRVREV